MSSRTRSEILAEVDDLADEVMEMVEDINHEEARGEVWATFPELFDEYRAAPAEPSAAPVAKSVHRASLADVIAEAVAKRADDLAWTRWPNRSIAEIRGELWLSPDGEALYDLARSDLGKQPFDDVRATLAKSFAHADAWRVLERWLD